MSMFDRVAAAIEAAGIEDPSGCVYVSPRLAAEAALKALLEPTDEMIAAGSTDDGEERHPYSCFRHMIQEALKD